MDYRNSTLFAADSDDIIPIHCYTGKLSEEFRIPCLGRVFAAVSTQRNHHLYVMQLLLSTVQMVQSDWLDTTVVVLSDTLYHDQLQEYLHVGGGIRAEGQFWYEQESKLLNQQIAAHALCCQSSCLTQRLLVGFMRERGCYQGRSKNNDELNPQEQ